MTFMFESVHTMSDWYDGPIGGVADCAGRPHVYEALWDEELQRFGPRFRLSPIDAATLALAVEDWQIWLRWDEAFRAGAVDESTHPALPAERARHEELHALLAAKLVVDQERAFVVCGEFRWTPRPPGKPLAEVRWHSPA
jgi:hypothetical protein